MEYGNGRSARSELRVSLPRSGQFDESKTDLRPMPSKDFRAERSREQLGTQTHAKHRTILPYKFCDEVTFGSQKGMLLCFVGTHGTAHHNQAPNLIGSRKASSEIQAPDVRMDASPLSFGSNQPRALPLNMLQYCPRTSHRGVVAFRFPASPKGANHHPLGIGYTCNGSPKAPDIEKQTMQLGPEPMRPERRIALAT